MRSRIIKGFAALAAIAGLAFAVAAPAHAEYAPNALACITTLTVHESEDWGADGDEPKLVFDLGTWNSPGSMDNGSTAAVYRQVNTGTIVQAWDRDSPDPDDFIGSARVGSTAGTLSFSGDDASYTARYKIGVC